MFFVEGLYNIIERIRRAFLNLKISMKILLFFLLLLIISVAANTILYRKIYSNIISSKMSEVSMQVLLSINSSIEANIEIIASYSKMVLSNEDVQEVLRNNKTYGDVNETRKIQLALQNFLEANPVISSIYIFDSSGNKFATDSFKEMNLKVGSLKEAAWYNDAVESRGGYIVSVNAGNIFIRNSEKNFISLIRLIKDVDTMKPIGMLIINITEDYLRNSYKGIIDKYGTDIALFDGADNCILRFNNLSSNDLVNTRQGQMTGDYGNAVVKCGDREFLVSHINDNRFNWRIVSIMPFGEISKETSVFSRVAFIVLAVNSMLLFLGSVLMSRLITKPIKTMIKSMKGIEKGEFNEVKINSGNDEIGELKDCYNFMISEIKKLISKLIEEQKIKRRAELEVLQAQIKPHFLYNTLETVRSFVLTGKTQEVNVVLRALGNYYRYSLSKGCEVIKIKEEIEIVRNYLTIQKSRYGDIFTAFFEVDEAVENYEILKLVLQPLVENSLYHGIKPSGEKGIIKVSAACEPGFVKLIVEDNGVGMDPEVMENATSVQTAGNKKSFGLRSTIERLRIFYGINDITRIESRKGIGTKIIISIPVERMIANE